YPSTTAAVDQTAGQVVLYAGKVATTYFFSSSGGRTANVTDVWQGSKPIPYLVSVVDAYDSISPYHNWGPYTFKVATLARKLHVSGKVLDVQATLNSSGRTSALVLTTSAGKTSVAAGDVRERLGLRSTWFSLGELSLAPPPGPVLYGARVTL